LGEGVVLPLTEGWRYHADPANAGIGSGWFRRSFPADDWRPIQMPAEGGWYQWIDEARDVVWYRNQVEVTPDMLRDHVYLYVPAADRNCLVWVNGELVLEHTAEAAGVVPERLWDTPFAVDVREHLDAAEPNVVVMRVDHPRIMGRVHFPVYLVATDAETSIEVLGEVAERIRERVEDHNG
ncbi:MAG: hypothetical protein ACP5KN_09700, partial [Armatimonadota bacterium]